MEGFLRGWRRKFGLTRKGKNKKKRKWDEEGSTLRPSRVFLSLTHSWKKSKKGEKRRDYIEGN